VADCPWREQRLVVELDSRRFHATVQAFEADRECDRHLTLAGWRTIRVTHRMLTSARGQLAKDLGRLLSYG
jgi:very-short-patch-repair endonuclease